MKIGKKYIVDNDNKVYNVTSLEENDAVREFLTDSFLPITWEEIQEQKNEIIDEYLEGAQEESRAWYYGLYNKDWRDDLDFINLEELEERLDEAIELKKGTKAYNEIFTEAKQFGYCS